MIPQCANAGLNAIKSNIERDGHFTRKAGTAPKRLGRLGAEPNQIARSGANSQGVSESVRCRVLRGERRAVHGRKREMAGG